MAAEDMEQLKLLYGMLERGEIDPSRIPPDLMPALEAMSLQAASSALQPRVLPPNEAVAALGEAKDGALGAGAVPGLDLRMMKDPSMKPEGYHDEFLREMEKAKASGAVAADGYDPRSAEVDAQLYQKDPTF